MKIAMLRISVLVYASITAAVFLSFSTFLPTYADFFLSLEIIVLPMIYGIGSVYVEERIAQEHKTKTSILSDKLDELNSKLYEQKTLSSRLKAELKIYGKTQKRNRY